MMMDSGIVVLELENERMIWQAADLFYCMVWLINEWVEIDSIVPEEGTMAPFDFLSEEENSAKIHSKMCFASQI